MTFLGWHLCEAARSTNRHMSKAIDGSCMRKIPQDSRKYLSLVQVAKTVSPALSPQHAQPTSSTNRNFLVSQREFAGMATLGKMSLKCFLLPIARLEPLDEGLEQQLGLVSTMEKEIRGGGLLLQLRGPKAHNQQKGGGGKT